MKRGRRNVLFLIPTLTGGGAERVMVTILRHLDRNLFVPVLAVVDTHNAVFLDEVPQDVEVVDLQCTRVRFALMKLVRLIWQRRPDVVLSTLGQLNLALALLRPILPNGVRYLARETIIVSAHLATKRRPWIWRSAYRRFYGRFDTVICQSLDMQKDLIHYFRVPREKTVIIHNPVDLVRIRQLATFPLADNHQQRPVSEKEECLRLVSIGRLEHQKGFDVLIDALAICGRSRLQLTILGEGPLLKDLEQRAITRGVANQVRFTGFHKNPYPFIAGADALVLSSRYEGFPNVVLEALACGTRVIAVPSPGGVEEILMGISGCVIAKDITAESLARAIECFSSNHPLDASVAKRYAAETITRRYEQELNGPKSEDHQ